MYAIRGLVGLELFAVREKGIQKEQREVGKTREENNINTMNHKIDIPNHLLPLQPNQKLVKCTCMCHKRKGIRHIQPCCFNGWKVVDKV